MKKYLLLASVFSIFISPTFAMLEEERQDFSHLNQCTLAELAEEQEMNLWSLNHKRISLAILFNRMKDESKVSSEEVEQFEKLMNAERQKFFAYEDEERKYVSWWTKQKSEEDSESWDFTQLNCLTKEREQIRKEIDTFAITLQKRDFLSKNYAIWGSEEAFQTWKAKNEAATADAKEKVENLYTFCASYDSLDPAVQEFKKLHNEFLVYECKFLKAAEEHFRSFNTPDEFEKGLLRDELFTHFIKLSQTQSAVAANLAASALFLQQTLAIPKVTREETQSVYGDMTHEEFLNQLGKESEKHKEAESAVRQQVLEMCRMNGQEPEKTLVFHVILEFENKISELMLTIYPIKLKVLD